MNQKFYELAKKIADWLNRRCNWKKQVNRSYHHDYSVL